MAKDRLTPCKYYVCKGECEQGREADHEGYCQRCKLYKARAKVRHLNIKKQKLNKIKEKEME